MANLYTRLLLLYLGVLVLVICPVLSQDTTASMNTTAATSNDTTITMATTTTTMKSTTTTSPPFDVKHNTETAILVLELTVGMLNSTADIQYSGNMTRQQLLEKFMTALKVDNAQLDLIDSPDEDDHSYILLMKYWFGQISNSSADEDELKSNLTELNGEQGFSVMLNQTFVKIDIFFTSTNDVCSAMGVCPIGFMCNSLGCERMCDDETYCHGNGECVVSVLKNGTAVPICICDESYDTEYYGDHCEDSRIGKEQVIAIVAGVLGTACLILIIIVIFMCIKSRRESENYDISHSNGPRGRATPYANKAYDETPTS